MVANPQIHNVNVADQRVLISPSTLRTSSRFQRRSMSLSLRPGRRSNRSLTDKIID